MTLQPEVFLPSEIISLVISFVSEGRKTQAVQNTLHSCSLVSRQWYQATTPYLYEIPRITGENYESFAKVLYKQRRARGPCIPLGQLVRRLDMSRLVHHSSTSLTIRLLGSIKANLEVFTAPAASFTTISLPSITKCSRLRVLDLSLVMSPITWVALKSAIEPLTRLETLRFPRLLRHDPKAKLTHQGRWTPWPPKLSRLQIGGRIDREVLRSFNWPDTVSSVKLNIGSDFTLDNALSAISINQLFAKLKRLRFSCPVSDVDESYIVMIPSLIGSLKFLSMPGHFWCSEFLREVAQMESPLELEILEFCCSPWIVESLVGEVADVLVDRLRNVRRLGLHESYLSLVPESLEEEVESLLKQNAINSGYPKEQVENGEIQYGIYYIEDRG